MKVRWIHVGAVRWIIKNVIMNIYCLFFNEFDPLMPKRIQLILRTILHGYPLLLAYIMKSYHILPGICRIFYCSTLKV